MTTVITHFYNERYLLPQWLQHHRDIFSHGILIDYASSDGSVEICKTLCPEWEIVSSRNDYFDAHACDSEVMDIESSIQGWKMVLNMTEFLDCPDIAVLLKMLDAQGFNGAMLTYAIMVDPPELRDVPLDPEVPLLQQRYSGLLVGEHHKGDIYDARRQRLIHRHRNGAYAVGRHTTEHQDILDSPEGARVLWYGLSPWTPEGRARKMQIKARMSEYDKQNRLGWQHLLSEEELESLWKDEAQYTHQLVPLVGFV